MSKSPWLFIPFFLLVLLTSPATPARALGDDAPLDPRLTVTEARENEIHAAIELDIAPGWHTYAQEPGDAGLPPRFDWAGSVNAGDVRIDWPKPQRFDEQGLTTYGYSTRAVFPVTATRPDPAQPGTLALALNIMACKDICIPMAFALNAEIPAAP